MKNLREHHGLPAALVALALVALALALVSACGGSGSGNGEAASGPDAGAEDLTDEWDDKLAEREVDYNAALRIAALRLTGELPTLAELKAVQMAGTFEQQAAAYEGLVQGYIDGPRFAPQMVRFWRDTFKLGETSPDADRAPVFAAQVTVEGRSYNELFTATTGTCPTFDEATGVFTPADCQNGVPTHAGVLSNPGVMAQFFSNLAFRRVRWVQEIFDCTAFPAEIGEPQDVGGASMYNGVWPFESVGSPATGGLVDFRNAESVVCANCHQTMNHIAPLFGMFDAGGQYQTTYAVPVPSDGTPMARIEDWLAPGESTAWRYGVAAADLPALGQAMAADDRVAECAVARAWNWAMGKSDIVDTLSVVPSETIAAQVSSFKSGGYNLKAVLFDVFTSDDFVRF